MHPIAPFARHAFAAGLARSGGPVTERTRAGSVAAVAIACEHADDPRILEVTLKLGSLHGVWAQIFDRRDRIADEQTRLVAAAWRKAFTRQAIGDAVKAFRQGLPAVTEADRPDPDLTARAINAAKVLLGALPYGLAWAGIRRALRDAVATGRAEGAVSAVALAGDAAGRVGLDWDIAFDTAYEQLDNLDDLWGDADGWLGRILDRSAADLGRALAGAASSQASYSDMLDAAVSVLSGADVESVAFVVDWALNTGLAQGALSLYRSEGVTSVSWLTAGDDSVCPICEGNEENSPFPIEDFPMCPAHPRCRCTPAGESTIPAAFEAAFTA